MSTSAARSSTLVLAALSAGTLALACTASLSDPPGGAAAGSPSTPPGAGAPGSGSTPSTGTSGGAGPSAGTTGGTGSTPPGGTTGGTSTTPPGSTGGTASPPTTMPPPTTSTPTPEAAGPLVLLRLTNREYNHVVSDLLGDTTHPADEFPDDEAGSGGFVSPTNVALLNAQHYEETAGTLAEAALAANKLQIPCTNPAANAEATCAQNFINQFGKLAFRRPVQAAELSGLSSLFTTARGLGFDFKSSIAQVAKAILQAPGFLYHWEIGPSKGTPQNGVVALTPYQVASRLSFFLWETMPDAALIAAADAGQLSTPEQVQTQAERLLADPKAQNVMENFHTQWLFLENLANLQKDTAAYPLFSDTVRQALVPELKSFTSSVILNSGDGTLKSLLTAPYAFVNAATAPIYGATASGTGLTKTNLDATRRAGLLTQSAFLSSRAGTSESNPTYRGVAIFKQLLCGTVPPPPANVPDVQPPAANLTTRQRYEAHDMNPCATGCHTRFDPYGFAFENYDGIGAYRTMDNGQAVNAAGSAPTPGGGTLTFNNAIELANALAASDEVKWCTTRQWFRYMLGRMETSTEQGSLELAYRAAAQNPGFSIRDMLLSTTRSMAFRSRAVAAGETF